MGIFPLLRAYFGCAEKLNARSYQVSQELIVPLRQISRGRHKNDFLRVRHTYRSTVRAWPNPAVQANIASCLVENSTMAATDWTVPNRPEPDAGVTKKFDETHSLFFIAVSFIEHVRSNARSAAGQFDL